MAVMQYIGKCLLLSATLDSRASTLRLNITSEKKSTSIADILRLPAMAYIITDGPRRMNSFQTLSLEPTVQPQDPPEAQSMAQCSIQTCRERRSALQRSEASTRSLNEIELRHR